MSSEQNTTGTSGNDSLSVGTDPTEFLQILGTSGNDTIDFCSNGDAYVSLSYSSFGSVSVDLSGNTISKFSDTARTTSSGTDTLTNRLDVLSSSSSGGTEVAGTSGADVFTGGGDTSVGTDEYFYQEFKPGLGDDTITGASIPDNANGTGLAKDGTVFFYTRVDWQSVGQDITVTMTGPGSGTATYASGGVAYTDTLINVNNFETGSGNDTVTGSSLSEQFRPKGGNDVIDGGDGIDELRYSSATEAVNANLATGTVSADGFGGTDTVSGIEDLRGGSFNDTLIGSSDGNGIRGLSGTDSIAGGDGDDVLYGNTGSDTISGGSGAESIFGGQDADLIYGNEGGDIAYGNLADDTLFGGSGSDTLYGGQGDDLISAGVGDDVLLGNRGNDLLVGGSGGDTYSFGSSEQGADTVSGFNATEGDLIDVVDTSSVIIGLSGNDVLLTYDGGTIQLVGVPPSDFTIDYLI